MLLNQRYNNAAILQGEIHQILSLFLFSAPKKTDDFCQTGLFWIKFLFSFYELMPCSAIAAMRRRCLSIKRKATNLEGYFSPFFFCIK